MRVSRADLKKVASKFLEVLDRERVSGLKDLLAKINVDVCVDEREMVRFGESFETESLIMDYIRVDAGIPIELRFNLRKGSTRAIVKCSGQIEGYTPFAIDPFGNIIQDRAVERLGGDELGRNELRYLSSLDDNSQPND